MAWEFVADIPWAKVINLHFSRIIGSDVYILDRGANFYRLSLISGAYTALPPPPYLGQDVQNRSLLYRNGYLFCLDDGQLTWGARRISWFRLPNGPWASSSQIPNDPWMGVIRMRSFCFADDDTIWVWVVRSGQNRAKCARYVISTDTFTTWIGQTGLLAITPQCRCAALNAAGTIVYGGQIGATVGCYGTYTIGADAYAFSPAHQVGGVDVNWAFFNDPLRLWYYDVAGAITNWQHGYFDIATLTFHDDYWLACADRAGGAIGNIGVDELNSIINEVRPAPEPSVMRDGFFVPSVQTDPATEVT